MNIVASEPIPQQNSQLISQCAEHWIVKVAGIYECSICLQTINDGEAVTTHKCDAGTHAFHEQCLKPWLSQARKCPVCQKSVGIYQGTQPLETSDFMAVETRGFSLAGYNCPTLVITYHIADGIQKDNHPNPGENYYGTSRRAYLPFNNEGCDILRLLKVAWDNKCIFKVGTSLTTGEDNVVCWGIIPHKTVPNTHATETVEFGYPDNSYFDRVRYACNNLGIF